MTPPPVNSPEFINPLHDPDWDSRIARFSGASIFHTRAWARVLVDAYGYRPHYVRATENAGLLPMMEVNSWLTGRRGISLPFTDECPALYQASDGFRSLFDSVLSFARRQRWAYYELRGPAAPDCDFPPSVSYFGHVLELQPDTKALFATFDSAVRRAVRKAEQENVSIEFSQELSGMQEFYALLCKTRTRHGLPPQPFRFFEHIHRHLIATGQGRIVLARSGEKTIAGAVFFHFGRTVLYKFGASDERFQQLRGNNLVMWRAIERYATEGYTSLDFGRTSLANEGLRRFKLSWGTRERPVTYLRHDAKKNTFVSSTDQASGGWHNRFFRALPGGLSRLIGAAAYRHLA